jgi:hypothetical protein
VPQECEFHQPVIQDSDVIHTQSSAEHIQVILTSL